MPEHLPSSNLPHLGQLSYMVDKDNHWNIRAPKQIGSYTDLISREGRKATVSKNIRFHIRLTLIGTNSDSSKIFYLCTNNINTTVITSIQLQHPGLIELRPVIYGCYRLSAMVNELKVLAHTKRHVCILSQKVRIRLREALGSSHYK